MFELALKIQSYLLCFGVFGRSKYRTPGGVWMYRFFFWMLKRIKKSNIPTWVISSCRRSLYRPSGTIFVYTHPFILSENDWKMSNHLQSIVSRSHDHSQFRWARILRDTNIYVPSNGVNMSNWHPLYATSWHPNWKVTHIQYIIFWWFPVWTQLGVSKNKGTQKNGWFFFHGKPY